MSEPSNYLRKLGALVRARREALGLTRKDLAERAQLSERFLAQLELGEGNISLLRLADVARALSVSSSSLLAQVEHELASPRTIALLGVRGAGKSTVGAELAAQLGRKFVELDREIERASGLQLAELFEVHGEAHYRKLERDVLARFVATSEPLVLATGGSIVTHAENFALLQQSCTTIWLRATAEQHWKRVIAQGDARPMAKNPHAFEQLKALLSERVPQYQRANLAVDTGKRTPTAVVREIVAAVG